jgi:hypothetical protein
MARPARPLLGAASMRTFRHFADASPAVFAAAAVFLGVACGDDDEAEATASTTASGATSSATVGSGGASSSSGAGGTGGEAVETPLPELHLAATPTQTVPAAPMIHARAGHTATLLDDGTVVVIGGEDLGADRAQIATVERYDPAADTWTELPALPEGRLNHTSTLLVDGTILIVGGGGSNDIGSPSGVDVRASALILDPITGAIETIAGPAEPRHGHLAVRLPSGKVLVVGGADADSILVHAPGAGGDIPFGQPLASAEIYDPATKTFAPTGSTAVPHSSFTLVGLADGRALVSGGVSSPEGDASSDMNEVFDEATGAFTVVGPFEGDARLHHAASRLADGRVLVFGGKEPNVAFLSDLQMFDPAAGAFTYVGSTFSSRTVPNVVPTQAGGAVVLAGLRCGASGCENPKETFIVAVDGDVSDGPALQYGRASASATVLLDGSILVAGGYVFASITAVERLVP